MAISFAIMTEIWSTEDIWILFFLHFMCSQCLFVFTSISDAVPWFHRRH